MKKGLSVGITLVCTIADIGVSTVLFSHGKNFEEEFRSGIFHFVYSKSTFDLWISDFLRFLFYIGSVIAVIKNPEESTRRLGKSKRLPVVLMVSFWMYTVVKLLYVSESDELKDKWFWIQFGWSFISALYFLVHILILKRTDIPDLDALTVIVNENSVDDRSPLVNVVENDEEDDNNDTNDDIDDDEEESEEGKKKGVTIFNLFEYSKPDLPFLLLAGFFLVIASVGEIFIPFYTGQVIDSIVIEKSQSAFVKNIIIMSVISFVSALAGGLRGGVFTFTMARLNIRVRNLLFSSIVRQEIGFFDKVKTGDITSRLTTDTTVMSDTVSLNVNIFLRSMIKGIGTIFFMVKLSWRLSLLTLVGIPIVVFVSEIYGKYYQKLSEKVQDSLAKANHVAEEVVSTIRTVRSFANEDEERERYKTAMSATYQLNKKQALVYTGYRWCTQIFELALTVSVLYYGGHLVIARYISGGNLVSFILYQLELGNCIDEIGEVYTGLMQAVGASAKVFEYMHRQPEIENKGTLTPAKFSGRIEFDDVSFAYPTRKDNPVLKNVSFTVNPGEVVALVGPSGGGKSSCINLIQHFYTERSGRVLIDSLPIKEYDHRYLHSKIALVGQEPVLYARSIADNIRYGMGNNAADDNRVKHVAKLANAHQFIEDMKDKYGTECGEKGIQLSGGQKQRLAIARALIRDPAILLLDEATSALDSESEHVVQQAIYQNLGGRTVIIIAHRLSTVEKADRIIVIDKGQVMEQGTHSELLSQNGLYSKLVQRQMLGFDEVIIQCKESHVARSSRMGQSRRRSRPKQLLSKSVSPNRGLYSPSSH